LVSHRLSKWIHQTFTTLAINAIISNTTVPEPKGNSTNRPEKTITNNVPGHSKAMNEMREMVRKKGSF
jgi:hypothetical protein